MHTWRDEVNKNLQFACERVLTSHEFRFAQCMHSHQHKHSMIREAQCVNILEKNILVDVKDLRTLTYTPKPSDMVTCTHRATRKHVLCLHTNPTVITANDSLDLALMMSHAF